MSPTYRGAIDDVKRSLLQPLFEKERASGAAATSLSAQAMAVRVDVALVCLYAMLLGSLVWVWNAALWLLDAIWSRRPWRYDAGRKSLIAWWNRRAITDELEGLVARALISATPLQLSLSSGKVYVGSAVEALDPSSAAKHVRIQPLMSGQRDSATGEVTYTTFYDDVVERLQAQEDRLRSFQIVIPVDKVVTVSGFDFIAYEDFLKQKTGDQSSTTPQPTATGVVHLRCSGGLIRQGHIARRRRQAKRAS